MIISSFGPQVASSDLICYYDALFTDNELQGPGHRLSNSGDKPRISTLNGAKYIISDSSNYPYYTYNTVDAQVSSMSIEVWCFNNDPGAGGYLFNVHSGGSGGQSRALRASGSQISFVGNGSSPQDQNSITSIPSNKWMHIVITLRDTNTLTVYVNGTLYGPYSKTLNISSSGGINLGNTFWHGANDSAVWRGGWASFKVYNKCISHGDVQANFHATRHRFGI